MSGRSEVAQPFPSKRVDQTEITLRMVVSRYLTGCKTYWCWVVANDFWEPILKAMGAPRHRQDLVVERSKKGIVTVWQLRQLPLVVLPVVAVDDALQIWVVIRDGFSYFVNPPSATLIPHGEKVMPARDPKEVFVKLLSDVRQNTERAAKIYQEIGQMAHRGVCGPHCGG